MGNLCQILMMRLQKNQLPRYCKFLVKCLCLLAAKHGAMNVIGALEGIQAGMTSMLMPVWVKTVEASPMNGAGAADRMEAKVLIVGMAKLVSEVDQIKGDEAIWTALFSSLVSVLDAGRTLVAAGDDDNDNDIGMDRLAFDGDAFSELKFAAAASVEDPLPEVQDAPAAAMQLLGQLCQSAPGVYTGRMSKLPQEKGAALMGLCQSHGVQLA